jgi:hypothetical protein
MSSGDANCFAGARVPGIVSLGEQAVDFGSGDEHVTQNPRRFEQPPRD